jgi:uncharacterized surface protein with fasciclin (FAS1) repeats
MWRAIVSTFVLLGVSSTFAFAPLHQCQPQLLVHEGRRESSATSTRRLEALEGKQSEAEMLDEAKNSNVVPFLKKFFPTFSTRLLNDDMIKAIVANPVTVFAPNEAAFAALGDKKLMQLDDPRNDEIRLKMGSYHVVPSAAISATELRTEDWSRGRPKDGSPPNTVISAVVSLSGEVPVGRKKSGGLFEFFGAKEDGDIVIGPNASIIKSFNVQDCIVHEVDSLASPELLWRYCDQLQIRLPGL